MADVIKRYNPTTKQWEVAAAGTTNGIIVTDPRLLSPDAGKTGVVAEPLNDVLVRQKEEQDKHAGYIAWLVEHGGGGSGGGGGATGDKITINNADIIEEGGANYLYSTVITNISLQYLISSTKNNKRYFINVSLDGNPIIKDKEAWSNTPGTLIIPKLDKYTSNANHSVVVTATDNDGFAAESYILNVVEASIKLSSSTSGSTATIGVDYIFTYTVISKIIGSAASLVVTNVTNGVAKTIDLGKTTSTAPRDVNVNLWDLGSINAGSSYTVQAQAFTDMSGSPIQSDIVTDRVVVEDGDNLVVLVEGITTKAEADGGTPKTKFTQGGNISFAFTPYLSGVSLIYYAVKLEHKGVVRYIGNFDSNYNQNQYVQKGKQQVFSWAIPEDGDVLGDWNITLRCWSEKGAPKTDTALICQVVASSQSLIPDQNPNEAMYASWNIRNEYFPQSTTAKVWESNIPNFTPPGALLPVGAKANLNVNDTNGVLSGFLNEDGQSIMRMAGESYGIIDIQPFSAATDNLDNWSRQGFSFSVTFKSDKHPFTDRTLFFCGDYNADEQFSEGIKVGLEDVTWSYTDGNIKETITCKIQQNVINTLDFVVNKNPDKKVVAIFVNGVLNVAREIKTDFTWRTNSKIYLACDISNKGNIQNWADVNFYDIKLFRVPLNDKEIVINAINSKARSTLLPDGSIDYTAYNSAKLKNFFSTSDNSTHSILWDDINNKYADLNFNSLISDTTRTLPIDIMLINCSNTGYTRAVFEKIGGVNNVWYSGCTMSYFSPSSGKSSAETTTDVSISNQGTSSMNYLIKNIEIRFDKMLKADDGTNLDYELFQPRDTWLPERQFTLKADIVDSAHANNASIGKWINDNADILFEKTPPMQELEARRPVDTREPSKVHQKVTVKQTLEGFPCILLIQFDGEETQSMLGIYSFNLGRGAYYNMGFRFLKDFTTKIKNSQEEYVDNPLPAFVTSYHAYGQNELFGSINQQKVFSYEIGENANIINDGSKTLPLALFMQDDISIIKHVGEFKYNGGNWLEPSAAVTDDNVWKGLQELFSLFAQMTSSTTKKYVWDDISKGYSETSSEYPAQSSWSTLAAELDMKFSIRNAYSYFLICVKFGLVDSLGKNMTLVCYDVGGTNKWYPRFYDMDTANALDNTGLESVAKTAYLDTFSNNTKTAVNSLVITKNSPEGGFDTYSSRMWDVLRDSIFINTGVYDSSLNQIWDLWRNNANIGYDSDHYIDNYYAAQTKNCGELLFDYDYNVKYLTAYVSEEGGSKSYANIEFLHGTRVEFVRDWIKKRWWFFDGVFQYDNVANLQPYNTRGSFSAGGSEKTNPEMTITSNVPMIFVVNIGNTSDTRYFLQEGVPTTIKLAPISSFNTQITINNTPQINDITGLREMRFQRFMNTMKLPSFSLLNLTGVDTLSSQPVPFETIFVNNENFSDVRHIDISNTKFWSGSAEVGTFTVNIEKYTKLKDINISNSVVTSMSLPNASLSSLNITNSTIETISIVNQPFLDKLDFTGCRRLKSVTVDSCEKITTLNLSNLGDLHTLNITNCGNLKTITAINNVKLTTFNVSNCNKVTSINLSGCTDGSLNIYIVGAPNIETLNVKDTNTTKYIQAAASLPNLRTLDIRNTSLPAIQYGNTPVGTYKGDMIFDVSNLKLTTFSVQNAAGVVHFKFDNNPNSPFPVGSSYFKGCVKLKRVFGFIRIDGTNTFAECTNFYINEPKTDAITPMYGGEWFGSNTSYSAGKTEWSKNTNLGTNLRYNTGNISNTFQNTKVSIYDVYYALYIVDAYANVTSIAALFYACKNIIWTVANSPHRDMFKHCGKVTNMSTAFYGFSEQKFVIYTPDRDSSGRVTKYNGLFSPLVSLNNLDYMFWFSGTRYADKYLFCPLEGGANWKVQTFNYTLSGLRFVENTNSAANLNLAIKSIKASEFLNNMPVLRMINNCMNNLNIDFDLLTDENGEQYCPLFYHNTALTQVQWSFQNLNVGSGSLLNLFGGTITGHTNKFPKAITHLNGCFNGSGLGNVEFPIHNSMFRRIKSTIQYVGNSTTNATNTGCFSGTKKVFKKEDTENFPYDVFKGCVSLKEANGFFYNLNAPANTEIQLPGTIFKDCVSLTNVSYMFHAMKNVKYTLTSNGFKNCKLVNASYCFSENESNYMKQGKIPYGLFYQELISNVSFKGFNASDAATYGISENYGIDSNGNWIPDSELSVPTERSYTYVKTSRRKTITSMARCLQYFQSTTAATYEMDYGNFTSSSYGDLLVPNDNYNPIKYIVNPDYNPAEYVDQEQTIPNPSRDIRRFILNPNYDNHKLAWNIYAFDGSSGFGDILRNSSLYADVQSGRVDVSTVIPYEFDDPANASSPQNIHKNKSIMTYFCPPDIFLSCKDESTTDVTGAFFYSGKSAGFTGDYLSYGLRGRIPPYIFKPISNVLNLSEVFYFLPNINPYKWNDQNSGEDGQMFSDELFANVKKVTTLTNTFAYCIIPDKVKVTSNMFRYNYQLNNVSYLFRGAEFRGADGYAQLDNIFFNTTNLRDISYCFASGSSSGDFFGRSPKVINSNLINAQTHKNIINCSGFLYGANKTKGSVPTFWTWLNALSSNNRNNVFYSMNKDFITNSADIPESWATGMVEPTPTT